LRAVAKLVVSTNTARELVNVRRQHPDWKLADWLRSITLSPQESQRLARLFTEETACHSLWIHVSTSAHTSDGGRTAGPSGGRSWHELVIAETSAQGDRHLSRFVW
jgi:hypothetical protein